MDNYKSVASIEASEVTDALNRFVISSPYVYVWGINYKLRIAALGRDSFHSSRSSIEIDTILWLSILTFQSDETP